MKYRLELLSYYDRSGIVRHLEGMAKKGWMLEKRIGLLWCYRRIEPSEIRFAVSYYPKNSDYAPQQSAAGEEFDELCAASGWEAVCRIGSMHFSAAGRRRFFRWKPIRRQSFPPSMPR